MDTYQTLSVKDSHGKSIPNLFERNGTYYIRARINGKSFLRASPYSTVTESRKWVERFIRTVKESRDISIMDEQLARKPFPTFEAIFSLYREAGRKQFAIDGKPGERTIENNISSMRTILRATRKTENLDALSITELNRELVENYSEVMIAKAGKDELKILRARITAGSTLRQAKAIFTRWALGYYVGKLTLPDVKPFLTTGKSVKRPSYRIPPLDLRERTFAEAAKLKEDKSDLYGAFLLCYDLGMRASEARECRWEWFETDDQGNRFCHICRRSYWKGPKNLVSHKVPVGATTWADLCAIRQDGNDFVLAGGNPSAREVLIKRMLADWMRSIGWDRNTYPKAAHELRKLAGSLWYTKAGLEWAARWLGDTAATVDHYYADLTCQREAILMR